MTGRAGVDLRMPRASLFFATFLVLLALAVDAVSADQVKDSCLFGMSVQYFILGWGGAVSGSVRFVRSHGARHCTVPRPPIAAARSSASFYFSI